MFKKTFLGAPLVPTLLLFFFFSTSAISSLEELEDVYAEDIRQEANALIGVIERVKYLQSNDIYNRVFALHNSVLDLNNIVNNSTDIDYMATETVNHLKLMATEFDAIVGIRTTIMRQLDAEDVRVATSIQRLQAISLRADNDLADTQAEIDSLRLLLGTAPNPAEIQARIRAREDILANLQEIKADVVEMLTFANDLATKLSEIRASISLLLVVLEESANVYRSTADVIEVFRELSRLSDALDSLNNLDSLDDLSDDLIASWDFIDGLEDALRANS